MDPFCAYCNCRIKGPFKTVDGKTYCKFSIQHGDEKCMKCHYPLKGQYSSFKQDKFHPECLRCYTCDEPLSQNIHKTKEGNLICKKDYLNTLEKETHRLSSSIIETEHNTDYFVCSLCQSSFRSISTSTVYSILICDDCSTRGRTDLSVEKLSLSSPNYDLQPNLLHNETENLLPEDSPWRKGKPWTKDTYDEIKRDIVSFKLLSQSGISHINILLIGEVGGGKSSFFNTVNSVFKGYVTSLANAGYMGKSVTTQYREYKVRAGDDREKIIKFRFCDTMGLEEDTGLAISDVEKILEGRVRDQTQLSGGILPNKEGYRTHPTLENQIHCLALVVAADTVSVTSEGLWDKMRRVREQATKRKISTLVLMTKCDLVCRHTERDTSKVFHSPEVKKKVMEIGNIFGIPPLNIHPVRNYFSEIDVDLPVDILALTATRQILRCADDFLQDMLDRERAEDKALREKIRNSKMNLKHSRGARSSTPYYQEASEEP